MEAVVIGNGQLAKAFKANPLLADAVIFASGVSNSRCTDEEKFEREKVLLLNKLEQYKDKKFVYFSSCALSVEGYPKNPYYEHKQNMENLIKQNSSNYYIFRIPQLFGQLKEHKTLINFLYFAILNEERFTVFDEAYRYVIEIQDVRLLVEKYLAYAESNIIVNLANPYRYSVIEIVNILESLANKKGNYRVVSKKDGYQLNLEALEQFIELHNVKIDFARDYLKNKLQNKL